MLNQWQKTGRTGGPDAPSKAWLLSEFVALVCTECHLIYATVQVSRWQRSAGLCFACTDIYAEENRSVYEQLERG
jgi:hypothetical protein